jgi:hypothetical protein
MIPIQSLSILSPIALTGQNGLYLAGGAIAGSLLTLAIIVGIFAAVYMPNQDDN